MHKTATGLQQSGLTKELEYIFILVWMLIFAIAFSETSLGNGSHQRESAG
jgi:hypothetical protein